jgi:hypothetical protein
MRFFHLQFFKFKLLLLVPIDEIRNGSEFCRILGELFRFVMEHPVSEHLDWVHNFVLIKCIFGSEKPWGVGNLGKGDTWAIKRAKGGISLRATGSRGGWILSQQGGFQVSE